MRFFYTKNTLFIRGNFRAASTGVAGGISDINTITNSSVPKDFECEDPAGYIHDIITGKGYENDGFFGLLTAVNMKDLCIFSCGYITAFITAGVTNPNPQGPGTINIIIHSAKSMPDSAMLEMVKTVTEAKTAALFDMGYKFTGTTTDAVIVAYDRDAAESAGMYCGTFTEPGMKAYECVRMGVKEAILRNESKVVRKKPSFFIYSTIGGAHWMEWSPDSCEYYPCHFKGQACDFCYCPFYPCHDEQLGDWIDSASGKKVWACTRCLLIHHPKVAKYLKKNPEAGLEDLKDTAKDYGLKIRE
ncbi:adenosylcobinamide amidohydrolase [Methanolacinia paynteri]|uniref:adenosylcobinamide amidohydrolase n=1 Tax=Methanolacinia paynteri TaxID=230356 RepID=UPI00064F0D7E|nr:adenosylcobinamide amidohydrolase [Methanolacinia paynteri]